MRNSIDIGHVQRWVDGYLAAWTNNDPTAIEALFTPDASYRQRPYATPKIGVDAIVADWIERKDEPGTWHRPTRAAARARRHSDRDWPGRLHRRRPLLQPVGDQVRRRRPSRGVHRMVDGPARTSPPRDHPRPAAGGTSGWTRPARSTARCLLPRSSSGQAPLQENVPPVELAVILLATGAVFWLVHVYSRSVGATWRIDGRPTASAGPETMREESPIILAAIPPAARRARRRCDRQCVRGGVVGILRRIAGQVVWVDDRSPRRRGIHEGVVARRRVNLGLGLVLVALKVVVSH